jgi:hypothetical protein
VLFVPHIDSIVGKVLLLNSKMITLIIIIMMMMMMTIIIIWMMIGTSSNHQDLLHLSLVTSSDTRIHTRCSRTRPHKTPPSSCSPHWTPPMMGIFVHFFSLCVFLLSAFVPIESFKEKRKKTIAMKLVPSITILIFVSSLALTCATTAERELMSPSMGRSGERNMMMMMKMMKGSKQKTKQNGRDVVPSRLLYFSTFVESSTLVSADSDNVLMTPGDMDLFSGPLYSFPEVDEDDDEQVALRNVVGSQYGVCTILQPAVSEYCHLTVYYNDGETQGSFTYIGAGFNPFPSTEKYVGELGIVALSGDFLVYTGGTVVPFVTPFGNIANNVTFF